MTRTIEQWPVSTTIDLSLAIAQAFQLVGTPLRDAPFVLQSGPHRVITKVALQKNGDTGNHWLELT